MSRMSFDIEIQMEVELSAEIQALLQTTAQTALIQQSAPNPSSLTLMLTDDAVLRDLNRSYRGFDKPTDVLSFEDGEAPFEGAPIYLGDIAISVPQAERQAEAGGHVVSAELQLLTVHGVLHLLGYDHATPDEKAAMWQAQAAILTELNAPIVAPAIE